MWNRRLASICATCGAIALATLIAASMGRRVSIPISKLLPAPADIEFVEFDLDGEQIGLPNRHGTLLPRSSHGFLVQFLAPSEKNKIAEDFVGVFPPLGEVRFHRKDGRINRVVFVEGGKNPLCFSIDGSPFLRGGAKYSRYLEDHEMYFGTKSEYLDESMVLARKLDEICGRTPE